MDNNKKKSYNISYNYLKTLLIFFLPIFNLFNILPSITSLISHNIQIDNIPINTTHNIIPNNTIIKG
jgi:hypothetical protein